MNLIKAIGVAMLVGVLVEALTLAVLALLFRDQLGELAAATKRLWGG